MDIVEGRLPPPPRRSRGQLMAVAGFGVVGIVAGGYLLARFMPEGIDPANGGGRGPSLTRAETRETIVPPPVEPTRLIDLTPDDARAVNAKVPFVTGRIVPARPFAFAGTPDDRARAVACLATAVLYEAGDDAIGEQAVAQVVLNRVRHPAFPRTVCGVVFQGSQLPTGCQFTFTCDGALERRVSDAAWLRAKYVAEAALAGHVMPTVGTATHYHTDWVVPYWASSLDKIGMVHTHLFYRWRGVWGLPPAFTGRYVGGETIDPRIAARVDPTVTELTEAELAAIEPGAANAAAAATAAASTTIDGVTAADLKGSTPRLVDNAAASYVLQLDPGAFPGSYAIAALNICARKSDCTVVGYQHADRLPSALPVSAEGLRRASFYYRVRKAVGIESVLWNCRDIPRPDPSQCLPGSAPAEAPAAK